MIVCVETASWVNAAPMVAVAGFDVAVTVVVACAITGVLLGAIVFVTAAVSVCACRRDLWVNPAWMVTACCVPCAAAVETF